jgi:hypothetical protein
MVSSSAAYNDLAIKKSPPFMKCKFYYPNHKTPPLVPDNLRQANPLNTLRNFLDRHFVFMVQSTSSFSSITFPDYNFVPVLIAVTLGT